ncbi:hypothetical protein ACL03H_06135 [Saccharopolyspora sp. MS10]|uniref:hypothetical protein n=1 Tax=Saccharopolyspora sp. MS10 TaxID=3385973 RepID=UPI0039A25B46
MSRWNPLRRLFGREARTRDDRTPAAPEAAGQWRRGAPLERVLRGEPAGVIRPARFRSSVASFRQHGVLAGGLGHRLAAEAPGGVMHGLVRGPGDPVRRASRASSPVVRPDSSPAAEFDPVFLAPPAASDSPPAVPDGAGAPVQRVAVRRVAPPLTRARPVTRFTPRRLPSVRAADGPVSAARSPVPGSGAASPVAPAPGSAAPAATGAEPASASAAPGSAPAAPDQVAVQRLPVAGAAPPGAGDDAELVVRRMGTGDDRTRTSREADAVPPAPGARTSGTTRPALGDADRAGSPQLGPGLGEPVQRMPTGAVPLHQDATPAPAGSQRPLARSSAPQPPPQPTEPARAADPGPRPVPGPPQQNTTARRPRRDGSPAEDAEVQRSAPSAARGGLGEPIARLPESATPLSPAPRSEDPAPLALPDTPEHPARSDPAPLLGGAPRVQRLPGGPGRTSADEPERRSARPGAVPIVRPAASSEVPTVHRLPPPGAPAPRPGQGHAPQGTRHPDVPAPNTPAPDSPNPAPSAPAPAPERARGGEAAAGTAEAPVLGAAPIQRTTGRAEPRSAPPPAARDTEDSPVVRRFPGEATPAAGPGHPAAAPREPAPVRRDAAQRPPAGNPPATAAAADPVRPNPPAPEPAATPRLTASPTAGPPLPTAGPGAANPAPEQVLQRSATTPPAAEDLGPSTAPAGRRPAPPPVQRALPLLGARPLTTRTRLAGQSPHHASPPPARVAPLRWSRREPATADPPGPHPVRRAISPARAELPPATGPGAAAAAPTPAAPAAPATPATAAPATSATPAPATPAAPADRPPLASRAPASRIQRSSTAPPAPPTPPQDEQPEAQVPGVPAGIPVTVVPKQHREPEPGQEPGASGGGDTDVDELARRLVEPVGRLLRTELRHGRERFGRTYDRRR